MRDVTKWAARVVGTGLVLLVAAIAIGEGAPPLGRLSATEGAQMAAMAAMLVGLLLAWRWPVAGGGIVLAGWLAFEAVQWQQGARLALNWVFVLFAVAGLLHVLSAWPRAPHGAG